MNQVSETFERVAVAFDDEPRRLPRPTDPPRPACVALLTARQWAAVLRIQDIYLASLASEGESA